MLRQAWRIVILLIGTTVLLIGVALLVLPGPAFVVIPVGLAILATEFAWARRCLQYTRNGVRKGTRLLGLKSLFSRNEITRFDQKDPPLSDLPSRLPPTAPPHRDQ